MKKACRPTYLIQDKESFMVAPDDIEGGHSPPLDSKGISDQFQFIVKATKGWSGDNEINKNISQILSQSNKNCEWKWRRSWNPKKVAHGYSKCINFDQQMCHAEQY